MDKLQLFIGLPVTTESGCRLKSPTIQSIAEIGEGLYHFYLSLATFNKDSIVSALFHPTTEEWHEIESYDDYQFLISTPLLSEIEHALSFFTEGKVKFFEGTFYLDSIPFLTEQNYKNLAIMIQEINGLEKKEKPKFKNKKAEDMYHRLQQMRKKYHKDESLSLKDICSILCNAEGNGVTVFNIGKLTIYQVYEHFERLSVKESHRRMLQVWANGHLKEDVKLQDWLIKTKL